jgi:hypothetical protein
MKRSVILGLLVVMLASSLACGPLSGGGRSSSSGLDIKIVNRSPDEICYVLISPSNDATWGPDQLGDNEVIRSGGDRTFSMPSGTYDLQVETCNEEVMATAWEIDRGLTVNVGERGAEGRLVLRNDSDSDVCVVRISASSGTEWGTDWLGSSETVDPGNARIFYVKAGWYDLQATGCDGTVLVEEYDVDLTQDLQWALGN